jgi:hypothetical protein
MADVKISGLPASTTPLAGTEVLPIVQSTATKQVSVANLTAGRAVSAASLALTGSPLPVGSGGTGTATTFTPGSVVFAGTSGLYSQNNASFFWDNTNKRLGLGTASPASFVDIFSADQGYAGLSLQGYAGATKWYVNAGISTVNINPFSISTNANGTSPAVCVYASGGVSIGNTTDAGAGNLSVTGVIKIGANQAVNGPAFSAGLAPSNQSVNASTATKITIDTEDFDTNSNYDPTTNYRFTPTVGGYYQISAGITANAAASGTVQILIYKNGTLYKSGSQVLLGAATATTVTVSCLVNMNGSSDYVELYCFQSSAAALLVFTNSTAATWFQGSMVRGL